MSIKKTLLEIVQEILDDMDSESVNAIGDTEEAQQIATIVESTFYNIIATRGIEAHKELLRPTALSDATYPTHFSLADNVKEVNIIWYDNSTDASFSYDEIKWLPPLTFLQKSDGLASNYTSVLDKNGTTNLRIGNDKIPEYFTSFDDNYLIMDSHKASVDSTLQQAKIRAYGTVYPVFDKTSGAYVPDISASYFPYLIAEAKSTCFSVLKGGIDQKIEQNARRQKAAIQNDKQRVTTPNNWSNYGR